MTQQNQPATGASNTHNTTTLRAQPEKGYYTLYGKAYYARIRDPLTELNTQKGVEQIPPQYRLDLGISAKGLEIAQQLGLKIQEPRGDIKNSFVRMTRKIKDQTNPDASRPGAYNAEGGQFDIQKLIGNGSDIKVKFWIPEDTAKDGFKYPVLMDLQIINLVEFEEKPKDAAPKPAATTAVAPKPEYKKYNTPTRQQATR